jgi:UDP-glucuronate 4-epimerase
VVEALLLRGDYVIIVDNVLDTYDLRLKHYNLSIINSSYSKNLLKLYNTDICDPVEMATIFENERPTHICHLAARAGVRASIERPADFVRTNIEGTSVLLDLSVKHEIKNFVYASSSCVYGGSDKELLSEDDPITRPVSPYAATKTTCELLAFTFNHLYGLNTTGLRIFTVYGPRGRPDMAPFKFIDRIIRGVPIQKYGDGSISRDYTFISDVVDGVVRAIDTPLGNEVINLAQGSSFPLKDFIGIVEGATGRRAIVECLPSHSGDVVKTCADISKARRLLGYNPSVCMPSLRYVTNQTDLCVAG